MSDRLTDGDRYTLRQAETASDTLWPYDAVERCEFYMRKGHRKADAMSYAVAWAKNAAEQAARRRR